jgi:hypothetical protein
MKEKILTRCGYRCDLCLAYCPNVEKNDQRRILSAGWHKYYRFRIKPKDIVCEGCMSGRNPRLIDMKCPVRPCVIRKKLDNCATCEKYVCDKLKHRIVYGRKVARILKIKIPAKDHERFIKPYESRRRLDWIRRKSKEK